jgi:hypothetical protein
MPALPARRPAVVGRRLSEGLCVAQQRSQGIRPQPGPLTASLFAARKGGGKRWSAAAAVGRRSAPARGGATPPRQQTPLPQLPAAHPATRTLTLPGIA